MNGPLNDPITISTEELIENPIIRLHSTTMPRNSYTYCQHLKEHLATLRFSCGLVNYEAWTTEPISSSWERNVVSNRIVGGDCLFHSSKVNLSEFSVQISSLCNRILATVLTSSLLSAHFYKKEAQMPNQIWFSPYRDYF